jgi:hypothetical protein
MSDMARRLVDRTTVARFWTREPTAFLEQRRRELERERDSYPLESDERRDVEWFLEILAEVLAARGST